MLGTETEKILFARYEKMCDFVANLDDDHSPNVRFVNAIIEGDNTSILRLLKEDGILCKENNSTPLVQGVFFKSCTALEIALCSNKILSALILLQNEYWTISEEVIKDREFFCQQADKHFSPSYQQSNDDIEMFKGLVKDPRSCDKTEETPTAQKFSANNIKTATNVSSSYAI